MILDLQSGDPQLVIDAGIGVIHLRMTRCAIVMVSMEKFTTCTLSRGAAGVKIKDSVWITKFYDSSPNKFVAPSISVSPDLGLITIRSTGAFEEPYLKILEALAGRCLAATLPKGIASE